MTLTLFFLSSCGNKKGSVGDSEAIIYSPSFAKGFTIKATPDNGNSILEIKNPWQGAQDVYRRVYLAKDSIVPKDFDGIVINGIPQRIVCMSSSYLSMLDSLGMIDKVVGVSGLPFISNEKIRLKGDSIVDIGYEGNIDYEKLAALKPDLVLLYSVNSVSSMEGKLKEMGIPYIYMGEFLEDSALGKSEWVVVLAELLDNRNAGITLVQRINHRYNSLKSIVDSKKGMRPKVMLNMPYSDSWLLPSSDSYFPKMIRDAGGDYLCQKNTGTRPIAIDKEEAFSFVSQADVWLNLGSVKTLTELFQRLPDFKNTRCIKNGKVFNDNYRLTEGGGNDTYESGIVNPDLILRDLIKIFHPELIMEDFVYYRQIK